MNNDGTVALNNFLQKTDQLYALAWAETSTGLANAPVWTAVCKIHGDEMGTGTGPQKHVAKDAAAREALRRLQSQSQPSVTNINAAPTNKSDRT